MNTKIYSGLRLCAVALCLSLLAACGGKSKAREALGENFIYVSQMTNTTLAESASAVKAGDFKFENDKLSATFNLTDSMFAPKDISADLAQYAMARYLTANSADQQVIDLINNMSKGEVPLTLTLSKGGDSQSYEFSGSQLKGLLKSGGSNLNTSAIGANIAELFVPWAKQQFGNAACTDITSRIDNKMIRIALTFSDLKQSPVGAVSNPAPALKGMLIDRADAEFNRFGALRQPLIDMIKSLNIDGIMLEYKGPDGKTAYGVRCEFGSDL